MIYLGLLLVGVALVLFWLSARQRRASGLPAGKILYQDTGLWHKVEKPLFDPQLNLTGKPDYLVEQDGVWIPVEVKSRPAPPAPFDSHIYQLAAYALLVTHTRGARPPYGIIRYRDRSYVIDFTPELETNLLNLLGDMRSQERGGPPDRSHAEATRCARCGYRSACDQRL